jgi:hypothetical protein
LANGELAINITDGKLFYKDNGGVVQTLATKGSAVVGGSTTQVQYNNAGTLAGSSNMTFDGTTLSTTSLAVGGTLGMTVGGALNGTAINLTGVSLGGTQTLSINGGTANGLAYLNGSKVLTTGSALTFDGTNFGVSGNQATAIATTLNNSNATVNAGSILKFNFGATNTGYVWNYYDGADFITALYGSKAVLWNIGSAGGSEQMRLTSTGLGIGTSSPAFKLTVQASGAGIVQTDGTRIFATYLDSSGVWLGSRSNNNLLFYTNNGSPQFTLDTAGNLGLGVTPSAWNTVKAFQFGNASVYGNGTADASFSQNAFYQTGWKYIGSAAASQYQQNSGAHSWYNAPSGTAGNAISFTQAMTLDASGNLLTGTTAVGSVSGNCVNLVPTSAGGYIAVGHNTGTSSGNYYSAFYYAGTAIGSITQTGTAAVLYNTTSDYRLKDVVGAVSGQGERIDALEPIEYIWKADGTHTRGFLAHKFQEVYAGSVNGTKDAVDEEGKPVYQSMQASSSEVIADLVAEIQSLRKRLAAAGI